MSLSVSQKARLYLEYRAGGGTSYVKYSCFEKLSNVVAVILDCDGVLIDEKTSYDKVIKESTTLLTEILTGYRLESNEPLTKTLYDIRAVGSFNNDAYTIQLLVEWTLAKIDSELDPEVMKRLEVLAGKSFDEILAYRQLKGYVAAPVLERWLNELKAKISKLEGTAAPLGSVEEELSLDPILTAAVKKVLQPEQPYGKGLLVTVFDESFYGSSEITRVRNSGPFFDFEGRLKNEKVLVSEATMNFLAEKRFALGICTGRGSWETWKTLGGLERYFHKPSCIFIGDHIIRDPGHANIYEKPNPWSLIEAVKNLEKQGPVLYVGNSAEDHLMYVRAKQQMEELLFAGVTDNDFRKLDYMLENEADVVIPTVNHLVKIFQLIDEF
ncbi:MAG: HAD family hydrolase [Candidatus Caldarchaeum sp.]